MEKIEHDRFKDAPWYVKDTKIYILVGGAGGIGSWVAVLLTRAGFSPVVYDFDTLELHNLGGQLYPKKFVEDKKVDALAKVIQSFCDETIIVKDEKLDESSPSNPYVISAFDNMLARKDMFDNWVLQFGSDPNAIFIDGRLTAEQIWIYCIKGGKDDDTINNQIKYKRDYIFPDADLPDDPCTFRQTSHSAAMIASHIVGFFTNHIANILSGDNDREVPFEWEYFIPGDLLTKNR